MVGQSTRWTGHERVKKAYLLERGVVVSARSALTRRTRNGCRLRWSNADDTPSNATATAINGFSGGLRTYTDRIGCNHTTQSTLIITEWNNYWMRSWTTNDGLGGRLLSHASAAMVDHRLRSKHRCCCCCCSDGGQHIWLHRRRRRHNSLCIITIYRHLGSEDAESEEGRRLKTTRKSRRRWRRRWRWRWRRRNQLTDRGYDETGQCKQC